MPHGYDWGVGVEDHPGGVDPEPHGVDIGVAVGAVFGWDAVYVDPSPVGEVFDGCLDDDDLLLDVGYHPIQGPISTLMPGPTGRSPSSPKSMRRVVFVICAGGGGHRDSVSRRRWGGSGSNKLERLGEGSRT